MVSGFCNLSEYNEGAFCRIVLHLNSLKFSDCSDLRKALAFLIKACCRYFFVS